MTLIKNPTHTNTKSELLAKQRLILNGLTTGEIFGYLVYKHRVGLLSFGYPVIALSGVAWAILR